jgi:ribonuclease-3
MAIGKEFFSLESAIDYKFSDVKYLETALTHSSYSNEKKSQGMNFPSNERLEFLGDSVLEIVISEFLFERYKRRSEGVLTKMRQYLVCEKTLAKVASSINLGEYINLGNGEELSECRKRPKILADALEALFGAVYIDSERSIETSKKVILLIFRDEIEKCSEMQRGDYKTMLQELVEKDGASVLEYRVVEESGPEHNKTFKVEVLINNNVVGTGVSNSKKDAQMQAAKLALSLFGVT